MHGETANTSEELPQPPSSVSAHDEQHALHEQKGEKGQSGAGQGQEGQQSAAPAQDKRSGLREKTTSAIRHLQRKKDGDSRCRVHIKVHSPSTQGILQFVMCAASSDEVSFQPGA